MKPFVLDCVSERTGYLLLPRNFLEGLGAPLARDYLIGHIRLFCLFEQLDTIAKRVEE
jgi:hypothetical protein